MVCSFCRPFAGFPSIGSSDAADTATWKLTYMGLDKFRLNGKYCDVTIRVEEKIFRCHRVVLASVCEFFDSMFEGNFKESSRDEIVTLCDIDAVSFQIILEMIYLGREPVLSEDNVYGLLRSSDFLRLQTIKHMCVEYILRYASSFSSINALEIFHLACGMNDPLMIETLSRYVVVYLKDLVQKDFFLEIAYDCLKLVLDTYRSSSVHCSSENFILDAIVRWVIYKNEERQKFFHKLIETVDFDKITSDCIEFWLKEFKIDYKAPTESETSKAPETTLALLKKLLFDAFPSNYEFANDDNAVPISFQDPPPGITPSIHVYVRLKNDDSENVINVFSSNESYNHGETGEQSSLPGPSSAVEHEALKLDWVISSTFSSQEYPILATSNNSELIYYLNPEKFRVYSSIDLSSDRYKELTHPGIPLHQSLTKTCATDSGHIYMYPIDIDMNIHCYDTAADSWFQIPKPETGVTKSGFIAEGNFLYLIEGVDSKKKISKECVQVYDFRSPKWLCLYKPLEPEKDDSRSWDFSLPAIDYYYKPPQCCLIDSKIFVYDGKTFRVFDITEKNWREMKLTSNLGVRFAGTKWANSPTDLRMICHGDYLLVFACYSSTYLSCNYKTEKFEELPLFDTSYCEIGYFKIENVIAFNSSKM